MQFYVVLEVNDSPTDPTTEVLPTARFQLGVTFQTRSLAMLKTWWCRNLEVKKIPQLIWTQGIS